MIRAMTTYLMLLSILLLISTRSEAQTRVCLPPDEITSILGRANKEAPLATVVSPQGALITIYTSAKGSWTLTLQLPSRPACIVAVGKDFNLLHRGGLFPDQDT